MALENILASIPGIGGYEAANQLRQRKQLADVQAAHGLMGIIGQMQEQQRRQQGIQKEDQLRAVLAQLPPDATPEMVTKAVTPFASPETLMKTLQGSQDRAAQREMMASEGKAKREAALEAAREKINAQLEAAKQRGEDQRTLMQMQIEGRRQMAQIASGLKPAPAVTPIDVLDEATGRVVKKDARTGQVLGISAMDQKQQGVLNQDTAMLLGTQSELDRLAAEANRMKEHPGLKKATGAMSVVPLVGGLATVPGTDAANFKAGLETLKSQVGFGVLQNMRNNSKTGGALGQVSDMENKLLQANLAALDRAQSSEEFDKALSRIIEYTDKAKDRLRAAYNMKHGDKPRAVQTEPSTPAAPAGMPEFATEEEAAAAGLKSGTKVKIGGKTGTWQ